LRIVMIGPPGAGKGTQAKRLTERFGMVHLSSGDILRAARAGGSPLARQLARYMDAGELVPDEVVVEVMAKAITEIPLNKPLLLDGFPRTVRQAEALDAQLSRASRSLDAVVVMDAEPELIVQRITGRRSCPNCGRIYHVKYLPPKRQGFCDVCGAELLRREDDNESVVHQRLRAYRTQTEPLIAYYRDRAAVRIIDIDGGESSDEVTAAIVEACGLAVEECARGDHVENA